MRAVSENVVRAPMATVDLWRSIESLASENWTEEAIASALAVPVRQIRKLRLLATVHPAILDQIGAGDMPREPSFAPSPPRRARIRLPSGSSSNRRRARAPSGGRSAQALEKTRFFARDAKFGEDERAAFGIVWQEDLFAEGDEDNRFTVDGEAFMSAQRAWLDAHMPKNGVLLETDEYGQRETAAEGAAHLDEAEEGRPDRLRRSIRATGPSMKSSSACPNRKRRRARTRVNRRR